MEIEVVSIEELIPYARNSRQHSPAQVAQIAGSIREFSFTNPILIDKDGGIVAGHGRVLAARQLGMTELPCVRLAHLSDRQRRAYIIADNRLAELATWDMESLLLELGELRMDDEFDMDLTGFSAEAMGEMLKAMEEPPAEGLTDPDDVPEVKAEAISKTGDVWLLGVYYQCEACGKQYTQEEGERIKECPCRG